MIYTIFSYWNSTELAGVFNAASALVNSGDFGGAIKFMVLVAVLSLAMTVLAGKGKMEEFWQWTLMVALFNGLLLAPKATVQIVDVTGTKTPVVVSNVPIGMAALAGGVSTIGHWLTVSYETVFALPNSLNFENNGMTFGQKVQQEINTLKPATIAWTNDFNNFYRECLAPDILSGVLSQDQINTTSNIWSLFANTNPGLYVTLSTVGTVTCPAAYNDLTTRLATGEVPTTLQRFGVSAYPQASSASAAMASVSSAIVDSHSYFNGIATSANAAVQQAIVSNSIIDAHCNMLAQTSNTALAAECLTQSEGFRQTNSSYVAMANIAQSSMPKLHNAIELIQYAVFPIILIFVIVAGHHGMSVIKTYAMSLMWIQLWPPLYAVTNYMMNVHASYWAGSTQGNAMALQYQQWISNSSVSDQAIAGMLTLTIPAIAAAIIKGGDIGAQAIGNMISPPHSVEKLATQMAEGNFQNGHIDISPEVHSGAFLENRRNSDGSSENIAANGVHTHDKGVTADKMNWKGESSQAYEAKLADSSSRAFANSQSQSQQAGTEMGAAFNSLNSIATTHRRDVSRSDAANVGRMGTIDDANSAVQKSVHQLSSETGISQAQAAEVMAAATAGTPGAGLLGSSAQIKISGKSSAQLADIAKKAEAYANENNLTQKISNAQQASRALTFDNKNSAGADGARRFDASLTHAAKYQETASNELRRSEELAHKAELVRSSGVALSNDLTTAITQSIMDQSRAKGGLTFGGHTYQNLQAREIDALMRNGDQDMQNLVNATSEKIMDERVEGLVKGRMPSEKQIEDDYSKRSLQERGTAAVSDFNNHNQSVVTQQQNQHGVNPNTGVRDDVTPQANAQIQQAALQTTPTTAADDRFGQKYHSDWDGNPTDRTPVAPSQSPGEIRQTGAALKGDVEDQLKNTDLKAAAAENAVSSVVPSATTFLIDKAIPGKASGAFFNQEKDKFHGGTGQAVIETAGFVGSIALTETGIGGAAEAAVVGTGDLILAGTGEVIPMVTAKQAAAQAAELTTRKAVGSAAAGAGVEGAENHFNAAPAAASAEPVKPEQAVQPAAPAAASAEPVKPEQAVQPAAPAAGSTEPVKLEQAVQPAAPAAASAEPVKPEQAVQPAAPAVGSTEPFAGSPGKSMLGELFSSDQGYVPQQNPEKFDELNEADGNMPPPEL